MEELEDRLLSNLSSRPLLATKSDAQLFVNRELEVRKIQQAIKNKMNAIILGTRGSGKTSLLNYVRYTIQNDDQVLSVGVNMSLGIKTSNDFLEILTMNLTESCKKLPFAKREKLMKTLKSSLEAMPIANKFSINLGDEPKEESDSYGFANLNRFEELLAKIEKNGTIACFFIDNADKDPKLFYDIISSLRDALWRTKARFIAAADISSPYLKPPMDAFFDVVIKLKPFSIAQTEELVNSRAGGDVVFAREVYEMINKNAEGNPRESLRITQSIIEEYVENLQKAPVGPIRQIRGNLANKTLLKSNLDIETKGSGEAKVYEENSRRIKEKKFQADLTKAAMDSLQKALAIRLALEAELIPIERLVIEYLLAHGPSSASDKDFQLAISVGRSRLVQILSKLEKRAILLSTIKNKRKFYSVSNNLDDRKAAYEK